MAQFDNDQVNEHCADPALNSMGAHEQAAAANERRRQQHLLLLSSSSSSSSTASSSAMSDGDRQSFVHAQRSQFERGHIPSAARFRQQANHLDRQRKHGSNRARQRAMNLQPNAFTALDDPLVAKEFVNKTVPTSQLHRQHSDGSSIGTQLMNVLKIDDDLSKSSSGALQSGTSNNMLMTHRQQQQQLQQQAKELDTCLNSSMPNIADGGLTDYNRHPQQGVAVDRQSVPLVLVSPADHGEAHHQQYLSQGSQPQIYAQSQHYEQYAIGDHLVPCPLNAPYHYHLHHDHLHLHHQPDTLIRPGLFQASDGHCDQILGDDAHLSYADLDEEINRHQRHHRQDATFKNLPESVVQANERVGVIESQQQQSYYPQQDRRHELQSYTDIDERGRRHVVDLNDRSNDDATTTLTALNSAVTNQPNRLNDTLKQSGSQTWRQSFTELTGTTAAQQPSCYLAESARIEPKHSFKSRNQPDSGNRSFNDARELENQQQQPQHGLAQADLDLDVTVQTNHSSNDIDEELKVCEWRDCGNTFLDMNEFVRHLEEKHVNLEPHEKNRYFCLWHNCKRNEQEFNARYKLLIHMRVHSGEKPYSCQKSANCKKSFSRLENLKIHVRSHTGEKPYSCKYENCSKSFTNSSDRIKHHKTHKDPKPYNCTQDGCTKRYTDPSSLRKHLRAHKRDSCGSMDLATPTACTSSFSSQMDHKSMLTQSATSHQLRHHDDDHHHQHHPENQAQYSYAGNQQPMIYSTTLNHQEQQQQQQQHLEPTYLNADYDPSREFANVLYGSSNASEISESMREAATDEASFYVDASFDRPRQQRENLHLTNLDEYNGRPQRAQQSQQPRRVQYEMSDRQHQRPPASRMRNQMELRHQQLARSWCGGSISEANMYPVANQRSREMISDPHQSSHQQHRTVLYPPSEGPQTRQSRELRFTQAPRDGQLDSSDISTDRGQQVSSARFQNSFRAANPQDQQAQHVQDWRAQEANVSHLPPDNNQRQIHYQQHQNQLTRRQQHEQLMRSMPANVAYYQS